MPVIAAVLLILCFFVFLALGVIARYEKRTAIWVYFTLSLLGLIGTLLMFYFYNWDLK